MFFSDKMRKITKKKLKEEKNSEATCMSNKYGKEKNVRKMNSKILSIVVIVHLGATNNNSVHDKDESV